MNKKTLTDRAAIGRIVAVYALFGSLWILLSDSIVGHIFRNPDMLQRISMFKGLAFIMATACLLYHLISQHVSRISEVNSRLELNMGRLKAALEKMELTDFSVDNISDAVQWITMDTRFWNVNRSACAMLGYSREELLTLSISDVDPYFNLEEWQNHLAEIRRTGSIQHSRYHKTKDGRIFPVEITSNYLRFNDTQYYCAVIRDVTDRVAAEKEASFFRSLIELTRDPFYVLNPDDCRMVYANRAACVHFEMDLEQVKTMHIPDWDPVFDMACIDNLRCQMREGNLARYETVHRVGSGKLVPVEVTASILIHEGREYTCGYFYDITERKATELVLKESEARYRTLSQEFKALLDGFPDGLTLLSPDLKVLWANAITSRTTGIEYENLVGRHCFEIRHGRDIPCEECIVRETFATGEEGKTIIFYQPSARTIELRSIPVQDENGDVVKVIEIGRDISDQIAAEAERRELERKLLHSQKLESLGILAGGIAHDFNNILTGILGNLSILRMQMPAENKVLERIEGCEKAVSQATGLTCQLLTFAKGGDPVKKPTDLRQIVRNSVSFALTGSNIAGEVTIQDDLWAVEADEGQIGQVVNNLLINAVQAMPHGGVVSVDMTNRLLEQNELSSLEEGHYVRIVVSDQGQGIAPEHLPKIFDPYFTTKESGTGLGLTSVYSIVRKHGGDIRVTSEVGRGTTFEVYLQASSTSFCQGNGSISQSVSVGKGSILVMDDEEYIREMILEMLSILGYNAEVCCSGEELVQRFREKAQQGCSPDVVILDLTVPGRMGGLEAAKFILEFDSTAKLIVASGYSNNPVMSNFRNHGFAAAITKPYRVEDISRALTSVMDK